MRCAGALHVGDWDFATTHGALQSQMQPTYSMEGRNTKMSKIGNRANRDQDGAVTVD